MVITTTHLAFRHDNDSYQPQVKGKQGKARPASEEHLLSSENYIIFKWTAIHNKLIKSNCFTIAMLDSSTCVKDLVLLLLLSIFGKQLVLGLRMNRIRAHTFMFYKITYLDKCLTILVIFFIKFHFSWEFGQRFQCYHAHEQLYTSYGRLKLSKKRN